MVAVGILGYFTHSQMSALREQGKRISGLGARLDSKSKTASLDLQEKCAAQAAAVFRESGSAKEPLAGYENHYNEKLNGCFVLMENTDSKLSAGKVTVSKFLSDAFEGRVVGNYFWQSDKVKKYWEVPPFQCDVTLPSGEKKVCHSDGEFDNLAKIYMQ